MHAVIDTENNAFNDYWNKLVAADPGQNPLYAPARDTDDVAGQSFIDHSFMVVSEQEPVFGCSLTLNQDKEGRRRLGFLGREASNLVNRRSLVKSSNNFQPEVIRLMQDHFRQLIDEVQPDTLEFLDPVSCGLMSPLTQVLLECGALPAVKKCQVLNLALPRADLLNKVDSQYRKLIEWGNENLCFDVIRGDRLEQLVSRLPELCNAAAVDDADAWSAYRELIEQGKGFVVQAWSPESHSGTDRISGLFIHNHHSCHYVLDDSSLQVDDLGLLHALLWRAIMHSRNIQCRHFDFGGWASNHSSIDAEKFGGVAHTRIKVSLNSP